MSLATCFMGPMDGTDFEALEEVRRITFPELPTFTATNPHNLVEAFMEPPRLPGRHVYERTGQVLADGRHVFKYVGVEAG